jgi:putative glycosyltransferase
MSISYVSTLYKSGPYIVEFVTRCRSLMSGDDELILVDDGSPDNSLELARNFAKSDRRITIVELSRNFGHHLAILAGLNSRKVRDLEK